MANPNGRPTALNGAANRSVRVATNGSGGGTKVDPSDPQVRKLVYNMYRGMLDQKHHQANVIVDNAPQDQVETDAGVGSRVESMIRQQSQLKGGGMNTAGAPPPPPPPPIPSALPQPRLPTEIPARAPVMNPPAALAGAMLKDKKPFTYTPGGIDLSEINSPHQNGGEGADSTTPVQSRSFRVLQTVLSNQDVEEPQGPVHIPNLRQQQKPSPQQQPTQYQPPSHYQPTALYQQPGVNSSAPSEEAPPEPKKYMGGSIPSRSFKMLQAMTSTDDASDNGVPASGSEASHPPDSDTQHAASQIPSPAWKSSIQSSPPSLSPISTLTTTNDNSSDSGISSPSKVSPSYTTTKDSKVYRQVSPRVTLNGPKQERVVNSALSHAKEPSSPFSQSTSSPTWKNSHSPKFFATHTTPNVVRLNEDGEDLDQECPRLMKIIRQESTSSQNSQEGTERRYEGGHIPSRVFRHLQTEYPGSPDEANDKKFQENSSHSEVKAIPSRVVRSFQNSGLDPEKSGELDYYCNGMSRTAANKDTVLKELTSQFDNLGARKKPRAAPGKVFRHLQVQYDTPEDDQCQEGPQQQTEEVHNFGYRGSKLPSPSFKFLQNQYHQQERPEETICEEREVHNAPEYEYEPLPYQGARLPGRTFRSLQDNMVAHPSVLKSGK